MAKRANEGSHHGKEHKEEVVQELTEEVIVQDVRKDAEQTAAAVAALSGKKGRPPVPLRTIAKAVWVGFASICLLLVVALGLRGRELFLSMGAGILWGLVATAGYRFNRKLKAERCERVRLPREYLLSWSFFGCEKRVPTNSLALHITLPLPTPQKKQKKIKIKIAAGHDSWCQGHSVPATSHPILDYPSRY
jgi:hypothetical protein